MISGLVRGMQVLTGLTEKQEDLFTICLIKIIHQVFLVEPSGILQ